MSHILLYGESYIFSFVCFRVFLVDCDRSCSSFLFNEKRCFDLTEANAVTKGTEIVKGLRQAPMEKLSRLK